MQVLIHAEATEHVSDIRFNKELIEWTRKELPVVVTFDFDNFSETSITNYGLDLARQADRLLVVIDILESKNLGGLIRFVDQLSRLQNKDLRLVLNGKSTELSKMSRAFGDRFFSNLSLEEQQKLVRDFLRRRQAA